MDTKTEIIEAAIDLFARQGFEPTTFAQIAKACGISQPGVYNHFKNKMDLLNSCALYAAGLGRDHIDKIARPELRASEKLMAYIDANLDWFKSQKKYALAVVALYYFAGSDEKAKALFHQIQTASIERLRLVLIQGGHESAWQLKSPDPAARFIHSLLVGEIYKVIYNPADKSSVKINKFLHAAIFDILHVKH